jgi:hypothetical protein
MEAAPFKKWLITLLTETFGMAPEGSDAYILDSGQAGLLGTIKTISAETASAMPKPGHTPIVAHCDHVLLLLRWFASYEEDQPIEPDWPGSWAVREVDEVAWADLRGEIQAKYEAVMSYLEAREEWHEAAVAASMMLLTHCAYHVGEVRQLLGVLSD